MTFEGTRDERRKAFALQVNRHGEIPARKYGVTRVSEITRLDDVGIPVWSSVRPLSETVSINSGKSLDSRMAKAGAIIEGIEFGAAEMPHGTFVVETENRLGEPHLCHDELLTCKGSVYTPDTPIAWEPVPHLNEQEPWWVPSDLVWMAQRHPTPLGHFQVSSNGLGSGYSLKDAGLSALYEVIERDAVAIFLHAQRVAGRWPVKVDPSTLDGEPKEIWGRAVAAGITPFLMDLTTDLGIPVFYAGFFDLGPASTGSFGGYGAHFDPRHAMARALLEAVQGRCAYLAGARDDLFRRSFLFLKRADQVMGVKTVDALPFGASAGDYARVEFLDAGEEFTALLKRLERHGFYDVFLKELAQEPVGDATLYVTRALIPGLEGYYCDTWVPGRRASAAAA